MRRQIGIISLAAFAALSMSVPSAPAAQNAPLCFAIAENYNNCMRQHQRPHYWGGGWGGGYAPHEGYGGYGGGYGGYGGGYDGGVWGDYYDDDYRQYRRARRYHRAQAQCAVWLAQMRANGCI